MKKHKLIKKSFSSGFTLVEILVVIIIIGVLSAGLLSLAVNQSTKARDSQKLENIRQIKNSLELYYQDKNCYPKATGTAFSNALANGSEWVENGAVYIKKMPRPAGSGTSYTYITDPASVDCPQWGVVFAKLSKASSLPICNIPTYAKSNSSCVPTDFDTTYGCISVGQITCGAPTPAPTGTITLPGTSPIPTPTNAPPGTTNLVQDGDHDGFYVGGPGPQITTGSQAFNGRTYYKTAATGSNFVFVVPTGLTAGDCDDDNANIFTSLSSSVIDQDHDGYYLGSTPLTNCVGTSSQYPMTGGLVASYAMNEGTGTNVADSSGFGNTAKFGSTFGLLGNWKLNGNTTDSSGNGINGTLVNSPTYTAGPWGVASTAVALNGSTQYVNVSSSTLNNVQKQLTVSGWFKVNSLFSANGWQTIFWKGNEPDWTTGGENRQYALFMRYDGTLYAVSTSVNNVGVIQTDLWGVVGDVSIGTWNYVALTINSDTGVMSLYLNGKLQNSRSDFSTSGIRSTTGAFRVGATPATSYFYLNGEVADFKIYNRALSQYEIQQSYSTTTNGLVGYWQLDDNFGRFNIADSSGLNSSGTLYNNLLGWWKMDESIGSTAYDSSGNGNSATTFNNPAWEPSALKFNGTDQHATVNSGMSSISGDNPWTISMWVYSLANAPSGSWRTIMEIGSCTTGYRNPMIYRDSNGYYTGGFRDTGNQYWFGNTLLNHWDYITLTYTGNLGQLSTYINGGHVYTSPPIASAGNGDGQSLTMARDGCGPSHYFNGYLTEVQVYSRALTASEVASLYGSSSGPSWTQPAKVGVSAMKFNGLSNYIDLGSPAALNLTGEMSMFMWVKPANAGTIGQMISQGDAGGAGGVFNVEIGRTANKFGVNWGNTALAPPTHDPGCLSNTTLSNNQWYFVGFTRSGSTGNWTCKLYVNPTNGVADRTYTTTVNPGTQKPTTIGKAGYLNLFYFNGLIDDIQVYNRALTSAEIAAIYNNSGSPIWDTGQSGGTALNFNRLSNIVGAPDSTSLRLGNKQTVTAWVNYNGNALGWERIVGKGLGNRNYGLWLYPDATGGWLYQISGCNNVQELVVPSTGWSFIAGTYDAAASSMKLYRNNNLVASGTCNATPPVDSEPLNIGAYGSGSPINSLSGLVDNVKIYNRALSTNELTELYNSGVPGTISRNYYKDSSGVFKYIKEAEIIAPNDSNDNNPLVW